MSCVKPASPTAQPLSPTPRDVRSAAYLVPDSDVSRFTLHENLVPATHQTTVRLPIVAQLVVTPIMGKRRHETDDRREAEKEKGQPDGTNRFNDLHVRPNRLPHDTSQPTSSFFDSCNIRLYLPDLP